VATECAVDILELGIHRELLSPLTFHPSSTAAAHSHDGAREAARLIVRVVGVVLARLRDRPVTPGHSQEHGFPDVDLDEAADDIEVDDDGDDFGPGGGRA
jgi:hypothetical protein